MRVNGSISGVKDSFIETLDKLYDISINPGEIISQEIIDIITDISCTVNKEISIFISRRGRVLDVSVGDYFTVQLPALDCRRGERRLSGIRCVHTHPDGNGQLSEVDISALINMRLDAMVAVGAKDGKMNNFYIGYLQPVSGELCEKYIIHGPYAANHITNINTLEIIKGIEKNINTKLPELTGEGKKERALLVGLDVPDDEGSSQDLLNELGELAATAGAEVVGRILQKRSKVDTAYFIGSGKAHEIGMLRQAYDVDMVVFDDELSGAQVRNLEEVIGVKVIDRTTLILDIFANRAITREGKLQVELAQLKYRLPRLIGLGKILSRTGGGIGTRGPGEKKLEIDRRHIRDRIKELENDLDEVKRNRDVQREKRRGSRIPIVSLVGYTNSGKSTLRNTLARLYQPDASLRKEDVLEANMLFATLDPTTRLIETPKGRSILISDTVGFIRKLPHDLVDAFRATLEEVVYSSLLIHVVDSSAHNAMEQINAVNNVLKQLNVLEKPIILALNKIDKVSDKDALTVFRGTFDNTIEISGLKSCGLEDLLSLMETKLFSQLKIVKLHIPYDKLSIKSSIYHDCNVISEDYDEKYVIITAEIDDNIIKKYSSYLYNFDNVISGNK